jgi:hypothetical protein
VVDVRWLSCAENEGGMSAMFVDYSNSAEKSNVGRIRVANFCSMGRCRDGRPRRSAAPWRWWETRRLDYTNWPSLLPLARPRPSDPKPEVGWLSTLM